MVQLGIAILLPDVVHNEVRQMQLTAALGAGTNPSLRITPHVTLKQPFHAKALEPVAEYFDVLLATLRPVEIHLLSLDVFEDDHVVFANVEPNETLERYRQDVLHDLAERFKVKPRDVEGASYRFHSTVAYNLTPEQFAKAREALTGADIDRRFTMTRIALFYYTGDTWIALRRGRISGG